MKCELVFFCREGVIDLMLKGKKLDASLTILARHWHISRIGVSYDTRVPPSPAPVIEAAENSGLAFAVPIVGFLSMHASTRASTFAKKPADGLGGNGTGRAVKGICADSWGVCVVGVGSAH